MLYAESTWIQISFDEDNVTQIRYIIYIKEYAQTEIKMHLAMNGKWKCANRW